VAHVCEETLRKRLTEFKQTNMAQLTRGELKKIQNRDPKQLERTPSTKSVEETMDPPSFTRKICREKLNNISEIDLNSMQEIIAEKAQKINQKLPEAYRL